MTERDETFRVRDRRRLDPETGEERAAAGDEIALPGGGVLRADETDPEAALPVSFDDLVRPYYVMGLTGLGVAPHPDDGRIETNLRVAQNAIEILELLGRLTEGNRSAEESQVLQQALYTLKVRYVELRDRGKSAS
mgnify:CR=1 FL=1